MFRSSSTAVLSIVACCIPWLSTSCVGEITPETVNTTDTYQVPADSLLLSGDVAIRGYVDRVAKTSHGYMLEGWTCLQDHNASIDVHLYVGGPAGTGVFVSGQRANKPNEAAVNAACSTGGVTHRFQFSLNSLIPGKTGQGLWVHAIHPSGAGPNPAIPASGVHRVPLTAAQGYVDRIAETSSGYMLEGWACLPGHDDSIDVHLYVGGPWGTGTFVSSQRADRNNEPGVNSACSTVGVTHRFQFPLSSLIPGNTGQGLWVHAIHPYGSGPNPTIPASGAHQVPLTEAQGYVDRIAETSHGHMLEGWACLKGHKESIDVHLYVGGPWTTGTFVASQRADRNNEPAVNSACLTGGVSHRFQFALDGLIAEHAGQGLWVHAIHPSGAGPNPSIPASGAHQVPSDDLYGDAPILGQVDGLFEGNTLQGWACLEGHNTSIDVHLYAGGPWGTGTHIGIQRAEWPNESAVNTACSTGGVTHRFVFALDGLSPELAGKSLWVHAIHPSGAGPNPVLGRSGESCIPCGDNACHCEAGYHYSSATCHDIDECITGWHECDPNATCTNLPGEYRCACLQGFTGDGFSCTGSEGCGDGVCAANENYQVCPHDCDHTLVVVVESSLADPLGSSFNQYIADLANQGHKVRVVVFPGGDAEDLKNLLFDQVDRFNVEGGLLVGNLPAAWYAQVAFGSNESFPVDLYLQDREAVWTDSNSDGKFEAHTTLNPTIFTSRLKGEASELQSYFARLHSYRTNGSLVDESAYIFMDDDWANHAGTFRLDEIYTNVDLVADTNYTTRANYIAKLTGPGAEFVYQWIHSSPAQLLIYGGGTLSTYELVELDPKGSFYNLFDCSAARFTQNNLGMTYVVRTSTGLAAIGSTKVGGIYNPQTFHSNLAAGQTWGESFRRWYNSSGRASDSWFLGIVILGDPLLTIQGNARGMLSAMPAREWTRADLDALDRIMMDRAEDPTLGSFEEYRLSNPQFFKD